MLRRKKRIKKFPSSSYTTLAVIVLTGIITLYIYKIRNYKETPYDVVIIDPKFYSELQDTTWHRINLGPFSIDTPKSYKYVKRQGIDSYVGELCSKTDTLWFDYGWYSNNFSKYYGNPDYKIEYFLIDNRKSVLVLPKTQNGIIGIYVQNVTKLDHLALGSSTIDNLDIKKKMLKSIRINIDL